MSQTVRLIPCWLYGFRSQAEKTKHVQQKVAEIGNAIEVIASNITLLSDSALKMKDCNESAEVIMQQLVEISRQNRQSIDEVQSQTDRTNQSALQIRTATEIIAGIASQTNLLLSAVHAVFSLPVKRYYL